MTSHLRNRIAGASLAVLLAAPALGQSLVVGSTFPVADTGLGGDVAVAHDGAFLAVWQEGPYVSARGFGAGGQSLGSPRRLSVFTRNSSSGHARAAALPNGDYAVVWIERYPWGGPLDRLMGVVVDTTGTPRVAPTPLATVDKSFVPSRLALAVGADGDLLAAWSYLGRVRIQRLTAATGSLLPTSAVLDAGPGGLRDLTLLPDGFAVATMALDTETQRTEVRRFTAGFTPRGPGFVLESPRGAISEIALAGDPAGRLLVAWHDELPSSESFDRIRGQLFAADGTPAAGPLDLVTGVSPTAAELRPLALGDVVASPQGSFLLTWSNGLYPFICGGPASVPHDCPLPLEIDLFARLVDADGSPGLPVIVDSLAARTELPGNAVPRGQGWLMLRDGDGIAAVQVDAVSPCGTGAAALCLADRFRVELEHTAGDAVAFGQPLRLSADTGAFWLFSPDNAEVVAKALDGTAVNGHHWLFFASLTDVAFDLVVTDTVTGAQRRYHNPQGRMASFADTRAFAGTVTAATSSRLAAPLGEPCGGPAGECFDDTLELGRFTARVAWKVPGGEMGLGRPLPFGARTGMFWFFSPRNVEMAVKVLDGRGVNGHFWVFYASLTDVEFDLLITDTTTGAERRYHNPAGTMASAADTNAFPAAP